MTTSITISGAGCCLVDQIYSPVDFSSPNASKYMSRCRGDGGLYPGRLVFAEEFEAFSGTTLIRCIEDLTGGELQPERNVGGPSIVALIHAAQLLHGTDAEVRFYGTRGNDEAGEFLRNRLAHTPVKLGHFSMLEGSTPATIVLSDPGYNMGHGERIFINEIGAARLFTAGDLDASFFDSDLVVFGGTALVPGLHNELPVLLERARSSGCITVVNTVYDFRSEMEKPGQRWTLGKSDNSYRNIDLLITDLDEALHLSGMNTLAASERFFMDQGVSAFIITNGIEETRCMSDGNLFRSPSRRGYPVSGALIRDLKGYPAGDTTGCGDNFVGGVLASMAWQLMEGDGELDLEDCITWGTVSGGFGCFHIGGTMIEKKAGEKLERIRPYLDNYKNQIHG